MGILDGKTEDEPLHAGEVFYVWSYLHHTKGYMVALQIFINHTDDHDLKVLLEDLLENSFSQENQQVEAMLKETGIRLPPAPPDRPNVDVQDIPAGARFYDGEIAAFVKKELMTGKITCSSIMGIAIREDIFSMFEDFHSQKAEYERKLLEVMKEKGWFVSPPINVQ
ncbi:DUF3231 family protein [Virgibacillus alimentarius]|uniref:DUF3231 family protein n=2 Tax=Virgibacillus alimentarius TaxID=698769 RepID=A0ABS4S699_9BACI|nr:MULTISPECIES: DUF3231 family protein [Virgibacillus]MBP2257006.1 hypothetical protein [Virgibacillus alimentarius]HLR68008.1 DUF3231 family protein [Virgibacillus sp.]